MTKRYSIFLSGLFCTFLGGMLVLSLLLPDRDFSPLENRYLQDVPTLSLDALHSGEFMEDAEAYTSDHIVGRDLWVSLKAWCERLSGKQENNGAYFAGQDTLIKRVDTPDPEALAGKMTALDKLVANVDVPVYFGLIPSAADIWSDRLPAGAPTADEQTIIRDMYAATQAIPIDVRAQLAAHAQQELYYRTDHHWTSLGAYYGYAALMQAIGMEPVPLDHYEKTTVSDGFYGTTFSSSGVRWVAPDRIDTYVPDQGITVTSYFDAQPAPGSLYVDRFLEEKDKYSYFLGGNQPLCVIETPHTDAPKVLVIRDSYADSMAPFLTAHFSQIHLYDLRYNWNSVKEYVADNGIDHVVVMYSISNFATDPNLGLLAR